MPPNVAVVDCGQAQVYYNAAAKGHNPHIVVDCRQAQVYYNSSEDGAYAELSCGLRAGAGLLQCPRYLPSACAFSSLAEWRAGDFDDALNHRPPRRRERGISPKSPTFTSSQRARSLTLLLRLPYLLLALSDATL